MKKIDVRHLEDVILETEYTSNPGTEYAYTDDVGWHEMWCEDVPKDGIPVEGYGRLFVEHTHGGEGEGDQAWVVVRIEDGKNDPRYFRKNGYYASFDGATFDGEFYEVEPIERLYISWESK